MATPVVVSAQALEFASVDAGSETLLEALSYNCGVTTTGAAYCWGGNLDGQLGNGTSTDSNLPVAVSGGHIFASVSAGSLHSCGVTTAGAAYCWGSDGVGQLGNGTSTESSVPVAVSGGHIFASVSAGSIHSCGVTTAGAAYCWGSNISGQLGDGTNTDSSVPVAVSGGHIFAFVSAGGSLSCGVTTAGAAYCWGANGVGQLGNGTHTYSSVPVAVSGGYTFASVSAGDERNCGVTTAGATYCWGWNGTGGLGNGTNTSFSNVPVAVSGGHTFASVSAGAAHNCGVTTAGVAYCWGNNAEGELGDDTNTDSNVPVAVSGGHTFASVNACAYHTCGVTTAGAAYCWGWNGTGGLGDGTNTDSDVPVAVTAAVNPPAAASQPVGGEGQAANLGEEPVAGFEQVLGDLLPTTPNAQAIRFTLTSGFTHFHWVSSPGETRTAVIDPDDFDAVVTVWQKEGRFDASSDRPEEVAVGPGDWMVVVESFDQGAGSYELSIVGPSAKLWSSTETFVPGTWKRTTHQISNVPSGETRQVVVGSSDFDVVFEVFQRMRRVDEHPAGIAEEIVLTGNWELIVKSRDGRLGAYTLSRRESVALG